jgi:ATP-binding cassette subfamily F protein uup
VTLIRFEKVSLEFGEQRLLLDANFTLNEDERVCLIGRNGAGKSSMLKLITGELQPDQGEIQFRQGLRISKLEQTLPNKPDLTVREFVTDGLAVLREQLRRHDELAGTQLDKYSLRELETLQREIDTGDGWDIERRVETVLTELKLPGERPMRELSGGWQRRVALGKALVAEPDVLLLDEPTNHLDISTIEWLEQTVRSYHGAVLFITHDRAFLQKLATRIIEIDRGNLTSWPGNYKNFLYQKEKALEEETRHNALFDKKLAEEETWIRQGIKARRTRNEGRVRALEALRVERSQRIKQEGRARIRLEEAEQSGRKVIEARNVSHGYNGEQLIDNFSLKIMRGDRIGLIGNNGVGKSTLLRILLDQLQPEKGSVKLGANLEIAYFDQLHRELDLEKTVAEVVGDGREFIKLNGKEIHVVSYMRDFLFSPQRARTPIKALSGGERNRILLAKLFTRPSNVLVLDEPTNDLDVEILEVLEERLTEYNGTLILVSHDRNFLDNVVTSVLVFEENGQLQEYVGGYSDWLRRNRSLEQKDTLPEKSVTETPMLPNTANTGAAKSTKLTYKLQRELDQLPGLIETLENEIAALQAQTGAPEFYNNPYDQIQPVLDLLGEKQKALEAKIERWSELESML